MTSQELITKFLQFFRAKQHARMPGASLIPENDPTVLFTTAGMHPLVPYLLGQPHPLGKRLCDVQPCLRTSDIDEVGDLTHHTFFEMLGNWSLGGYFKEEAIALSWEFLTAPENLGIPRERLAVSVFAGDQDAPRDEESARLWQQCGVPLDRIAYLPKADNWWGPAGVTGPCGPDTEMFYWTGEEPAPSKFDPTDKRWVEIWNDVFMQYRKTENGTYEPLQQKNVDTGMGVERTVAVLNGYGNVYEIDTIAPVMAAIRSRAIRADERAVRIVADHLLAAAMILADPAGVTPSNVERGYILRRLIRRAIRYGNALGMPSPFTADLASLYRHGYGERYPALMERANVISEQLNLEEERFVATLARGMKKLTQRFGQSGSGAVISGADAFDLFQTYGFPVELVEEVARERGWTVDRKGFDAAMQRHQEQSRTASAGRFRSGLADTTEQTTKLHTATHLLHAALRRVLGNHVQQKGSNITAERLRFDFSHTAKMTSEEIRQVETLVNEQIARALPVTVKEMTPAEAEQDGALGFFGHKYAARVTVYTVGDFSKEICAGPHVQNTAVLGQFKIIKEEASSAGVRRIKATVQ
ncbi:MAG: alanine--tRNA ligase [Patescibacteria group bacterium]|nr:alanine--tRNA ligase [Patescibacteria group bacterium]